MRPTLHFFSPCFPEGQGAELFLFRAVTTPLKLVFGNFVTANYSSPAQCLHSRLYPSVSARLLSGYFFQQTVQVNVFSSFLAQKLTFFPFAKNPTFSFPLVHFIAIASLKVSCSYPVSLGSRRVLSRNQCFDLDVQVSNPLLRFRF
jgi:hypothetical protein